MAWRKRKSKISHEQLADVLAEAGLLLRAGIGLSDALSIVHTGIDNARVARFVDEVREGITSAGGLAGSLAERPESFPSNLCPLLKRAEKNSELPVFLGQLAGFMRSVSLNQSRGRPRAGLYYPAAVIAVGVLVMSVLMIFVVPQFDELFRGFGADLPAWTMSIINVSNFFVDYWWLVFLIIIAAGSMVSAGGRKTLWIHRPVAWVKFRLPVLGSAFRLLDVLRLLRTVAFFQANGASQGTGVRAASQLAREPVFEAAFAQMADDLEHGSTLREVFEGEPLIPRKVAVGAAIGIQADALDETLVRIADGYELRIERQLQRYGGLMEPVMIVIVAVLVAWVVIGMYLPIFKMGQVV